MILGITTSTISKVVKRSWQLLHERRRRTCAPSAARRESITLVSDALQYGQCIAFPYFNIKRKSHKSQVTSHKSQVTSHKSQVTSHKSQVTSHKSLLIRPNFLRIDELYQAIQKNRLVIFQYRNYQRFCPTSHPH